MARHQVGLSPVAFQKLRDLTEEISRKRGVKISMAQVVVAALELVDRLESMEHEDDFEGFDAKTADRRIYY